MSNGQSDHQKRRRCVYSFAQRRHWRFSQCFYGTSCLPKHCRRHRPFYCYLCCWRFRRDTLWISANICVGQARYCYLSNVVYFLICTHKNCKTKRIFVSNKNLLPGAEATAYIYVRYIPFTIFEMKLRIIMNVSLQGNACLNLVTASALFYHHS